MKSIEFSSIHHHDGISSVQSNDLRSVAMRQANDFTESSLGVLETPSTDHRMNNERFRDLRFFSHGDQNASSLQSLKETAAGIKFWIREFSPDEMAVQNVV